MQSLHQSLLSAAMAAGLTGSALAQVPMNDASPEARPIDRVETNLIWSDEFNGTELDRTKWEPMIGNGCEYGICGWGNEELQYYTDRPSNLSVSDGRLMITAVRENFNGSSYTSARLRTLGKGEFHYGRIEARIKLPSTPGIWPAFWMLPTNSPYGGWAAGGEIDIMESVNYADRIYGTLHYGDSWPDNRSGGRSIAVPQDFNETYHTYAIEWTEDQIRWLLDGEVWQTAPKSAWYSAAAPGDDNAPFDQRFHMLLNVAVGGRFPGNPTGASQFPQTMEVDYVRVYSFGQKPRFNKPFELPGRIQMEAFDRGILGEAYNDTTADNLGGELRPEDGVDIEQTAGGGYNIGYIRPNEWMEYTVKFPQKGLYTVRSRFAAGAGSLGGSFGFSIDGESLGFPMSGLNTGGWQNWTEVTGTVRIDRPGLQTLRWENRGGDGLEFNMDWFEMTPAAAGMAEPIMQADDADLRAFVSAFVNHEEVADLAAPAGIFDSSDIRVFMDEWQAWQAEVPSGR